MLSDRDLRELTVRECIVEPFFPDNCEGATINLTLDSQVRKYVSEDPIVLGKEVTEDNYETIDLNKTDFWIKPNESVLIQTHEFIRVPNNMSAVIYERYSVKSLQLMISPAHYMNPGYRGKISLVAINVSPVPFKLVPGIKICQLGFFELSSEPLKPYENQDAKYMDARDVSISKLHLDKEIQEFLQLKGVQRVSEDMAKDLGNFLMVEIRKSAKKIAETLREKDERLNNG